jgi:hypothetical protein
LIGLILLPQSSESIKYASISDEWHVGQISKLYEFKTKFSKLYPVFENFQKYTLTAIPMTASPLIPLQITGKAFFLKKIKPWPPGTRGFFEKQTSLPLTRIAASYVVTCFFSH